MRILFLHTNRPDYLPDGLFHGLREVLGAGCVDVPRYDSMYAPLQEQLKNKLRGHGFSLYGLLADLPELAADRFYWQRELDKYDFVVIANIWWQLDQYLELCRLIPPQRLVVLDGADATECFPYASRLLKKPVTYFTPIRQSLYIKRELTPQGGAFGPSRFLPGWIRSTLGTPHNVASLAFAIPADHVTKVQAESKTKDFNRDIVDSEIAIGDRAENSHSADYPFLSENEYYEDMQHSRFGITTKRAGWDCMRHYEMAANGCVLAFRQLDEKPLMCAPHGLTSENCLIYKNRNDLVGQIAALSQVQYLAKLAATYAWISTNTTQVRARQLLDVYQDYLRFGEVRQICPALSLNT